MFHVDVSAWMPDPQQIKTVTAAPIDNLGTASIGIRFGAGDYTSSDVVVFLATQSERHENQFLETIARCDAIVEAAQAVRQYALKQVAALHPGEEIVAIISDVEEAQRG